MVEFKSIIDEWVRSSTLIVGIVVDFVVISDGIDDRNKVASRAPRKLEGTMNMSPRFFYKMSDLPGAYFAGL
jgi:hypothetical protein